MFAKIALGALGTLALAGIYVAQQGLVRVSVDEQKPGGQHLHLLVPAAAVPLGMKFVPDRKLREAAAQAGPWMPTIRVVCEQLGRVPDTDLVEVRDAEQHVRVAKRGGLLVVDVEAPGQEVHVSFPVKMLDRVARELESHAPLP